MSFLATILMEGGSECDLSVLDRKQVRDDVVSKPGVSQQKRVSSEFLHVCTVCVHVCVCVGGWVWVWVFEH